MAKGNGEVTMGAAAAGRSGEGARRGTAQTTPRSESPKSARRVSSVPPIVEEVLDEKRFTVEKFVECFDVMVEAAGGTAALRSLVLDLAVHGRLTERRGNDGDAQTLLATSTLAQPRRGRSSTDASLLDVPFPLKKGWVWCTLGDAVRPEVPISYGVLVPGPDVDAGVPFVRVQDLSVDHPPVMPAKRIASRISEQYSRTELQGGELLLGVVGSIGKVGVAPSTWAGANIARAVCRIMPRPEVETRYLGWLLQCRMLQEYFRSTTRTLAQPTLNVGMIRRAPIPLPSLAEQKRIVARVDQLMVLINELEAKQTRKRELGTRFAKASLDALTNAESPEEFDAAWKRVVENWETVLDGKERVGELQKAIIALALSGRLVRQIPIEGSAVCAELAGRGLPPGGAPNADLPLIPSSWTWIRFGSVVSFGPKNGYSPKGVEHKTGVKSITLTATTSGTFSGEYFKYIDEDIPKDSELWLSDGDILIQRGNTLDYVGVAAVYRGPKYTYIYPDLMMKTRVTSDVDLDYIHVALNSPVARAFITSRASGTSGTMPKINQGVLGAIPIPLPPLAEQKRIVERLVVLRAMCSELESAIRVSENRASRLVEAVAREIVA